MLPYIEVFSRRIPMYGLMAGLGVLLAVLYVKRAEKRYPALEADAELAFVYGIVGAFVGAKLLFLCTVLPELRADLPYLWTQTAAFLKNICLRALCSSADCTEHLRRPCCTPGLQGPLRKNC